MASQNHKLPPRVGAYALKGAWGRIKQEASRVLPMRDLHTNSFWISYLSLRHCKASPSLGTVCVKKNSVS